MLHSLAAFVLVLLALCSTVQSGRSNNVGKGQIRFEYLCHAILNDAGEVTAYQELTDVPKVAAENGHLKDHPFDFVGRCQKDPDCFNNLLPPDIVCVYPTTVVEGEEFELDCSDSYDPDAAYVGVDVIVNWGDGSPLEQDSQNIFSHTYTLAPTDFFETFEIFLNVSDRPFLPKCILRETATLPITVSFDRDRCFTLLSDGNVAGTCDNSGYCEDATITFYNATSGQGIAPCMSGVAQCIGGIVSILTAPVTPQPDLCDGVNNRCLPDSQFMDGSEECTAYQQCLPDDLIGSSYSCVTDCVPFTCANVVPGGAECSPPAGIPNGCGGFLDCGSASDGLFCNGLETCSPQYRIMPGAPVDCNDGKSCTTDYCHESTDECVNTPNDTLCPDFECTIGICDPSVLVSSGCKNVSRPDGTSCPSELGGECQSGVCVQTCFPDCTGKTCGDDGCGGSCGTANDGLSCTADSCDANGQPVFTPQPVCPTYPDNPCLTSVCNVNAQSPGTGCVNQTINEFGACTVPVLNIPGQCRSGACVDIERPDCSDGVDNDGDGFIDCADSDCDGVSIPPEECEQSVVCSGGQRVAQDKADGSACGSLPGEQCSAGVCICVPKTCQELGAACGAISDGCGNTLQCGVADDGLACNGVETCVGNQIVPGTPLVCDDGLFCNGQETCDNNLGCVAGTPPNCNDGVSCTSDSCDENLDACVSTPVDGNCDDQNECTADICDGQQGCLNTPVQDGTTCSSAPQGQCLSGACVCVPETCQSLGAECGLIGDGCGNTLNCGSADDGLACNGVETCVNNQIVAGTPLVCDDNNVCNGQETCDDNSGCVAGTPLSCDDGLFCNGEETCNPLSGCQPGTPPTCPADTECTSFACDEGVDGCVGTAVADGTACSTYENPVRDLYVCASGFCSGVEEARCFDGVDNDGANGQDCVDPSCSGLILNCTTAFAADAAQCNVGTKTCTPGESDGTSILCDSGLPVQNTVLHCGTCGVSCPTGATCVGSGSTATCQCPSETRVCNGVCTPIDESNCAACGDVCTGGKVCDGTQCVCPGYEEDCSGTCFLPGPCSDGGVGNEFCPGYRDCVAGVISCDFYNCSSLAGYACSIDLIGIPQSCNAEFGCCLPTDFCDADSDCPYGGCCPDDNRCPHLPDGVSCSANTLGTNDQVCGCGSNVECVDINSDGQNCGACGTVCATGETCQSGVCIATATCSDGIQNQDETDVDCGGSCPNTCPEGQSCLTDADCTTAFCNQTTLICEQPPCVPVTCQDVGFVCGEINDGCGNTLVCGTCPDWQACGGTSCQNVPCDPDCTGVSCVLPGGVCCGQFSSILKEGVQAPSQCTGGLTMCDGTCDQRCSDLQNDPFTCGSCDISCASSEVCLNGVCTNICDTCSAIEFCNEADPEHPVCEPQPCECLDGGGQFPCRIDSQTCCNRYTGVVQFTPEEPAQCAPGETLCDANCAQLCTTFFEDETCGQDCASLVNCTAFGATCDYGECVCPVGTILCGGVCVDEQNNCGGCGIVPDDGNECNGQESCSAGTIVFSGTPLADGTPCTGGTCSSGFCVPAACPSGLSRVTVTFDTVGEHIHAMPADAVDVVLHKAVGGGGIGCVETGGLRGGYGGAGRSLYNFVIGDASSTVFKFFIPKGGWYDGSTSQCFAAEDFVLFNSSTGDVEMIRLSGGGNGEDSFQGSSISSYTIGAGGEGAVGRTGGQQGVLPEGGTIGSYPFFEGGAGAAGCGTHSCFGCTGSVTILCQTGGAGPLMPDGTQFFSYSALSSGYGSGGSSGYGAGHNTGCEPPALHSPCGRGYGWGALVGSETAYLIMAEVTSSAGPGFAVLHYCSACGNGVVDAGEQCDDGNLVNGDGCSSTCTIEP